MKTIKLTKAQYEMLHDLWFANDLSDILIRGTLENPRQSTYDAISKKLNTWEDKQC